jgi:hypothetical protein
MKQKNNDPRGKPVPADDPNKPGFITDMEAYNKTIARWNNNPNSVSIAQDLVKQGVVNTANIDPTNCTKLEFYVLHFAYQNEQNIASDKESAVLNFHIAWSAEDIRRAVTGRLYPQAGDLRATDTNHRKNWIQSEKDDLNQQIALGNMSIVADGAYDMIMKYLDKLADYAKKD